MVVPAIGIVVGDHDRRVAPERTLFDRIDCGHDRGLFFQRCRIGRMSRVVLRELQVGHGRKVPGAERLIEIRQIVVVIGAHQVSAGVCSDCGN